MRSIHIIAATTSLCLCCFGADQSWSGKISDSFCGVEHKGGGEHPAVKVSDAECVAACRKKGAKYVFVSQGKVYQIENQNFAGLAARAGQNVRVTGNIAGDTLTVSQIASETKQHKGEKSSL